MARKMFSKSRDFLSWLRQNGLLIGTLLGVVFGVGLGFALREANLSDEVKLVIAYPGELFTRGLQLMILPLVITSLVSGAASLNARMNGKIALRTISYFLVTSLLSAILGVALVAAIQPGRGIDRTGIPEKEIDERKNTLLDNFLDLGRNIIPSNVFSALFMQTQTVIREVNETDFDGAVIGTVLQRDLEMKNGTNTLGVIFFCLVFGTVLGTLGERARGLIEGVKVVDEVIMLIVRGVMWSTPFGVASIIASNVINVANIVETMERLGLFVVTVLVGVLIFQLFVYQGIYFLVKRSNPFKFYFGLVQATATAFATASAAVTLPITFQCMDRLKVDTRISHFVLPIGVTVNMDGTALFVSVASIFIAQLNNHALSVGDYFTVVICATAVSVASASVPSAALALMFIVLNAINVPTSDIGLLFAVDWLADRFRTTNNMLGDCYAAVVVEHLSRAELEAMDKVNGYTTETQRVDLADDDEDVQTRSENFDEACNHGRVESV